MKPLTQGDLNTLCARLHEQHRDASMAVLIGDTEPRPEQIAVLAEGEAALRDRPDAMCAAPIQLYAHERLSTLVRSLRNVVRALERRGQE